MVMRDKDWISSGSGPFPGFAISTSPVLPACKSLRMRSWVLVSPGKRSDKRRSRPMDFSGETLFLISNAMRSSWFPHGLQNERIEFCAVELELQTNYVLSNRIDREPFGPPRTRVGDRFGHRLANCE